MVLELKKKKPQEMPLKYKYDVREHQLLKLIYDEDKLFLKFPFTIKSHSLNRSILVTLHFLFITTIYFFIHVEILELIKIVAKCIE